MAPPRSTSNATPTIGIENWAANSLIADNLIWNDGGSGISQGGQQSLILGNILWNNGRRADGGGGDGITSRNDNATYNGAGSFFSGNVATGNGIAGRAGQGYGYNEAAAGLTGIGFGVNAWAGPTGTANVLGTATGSAFPASLSATGTLSSNTALVAGGTNSITVAGSSGWPTISSTAGLQLVAGPVAGVAFENTSGASYVLFSANAVQGQDNPTVAAGDNLINYTGGNKDTGALAIVPWSDSATSSAIRMTPYLTRLVNAVALTPNTPATSSAACTAGQIGVDASYVYVCTATNTWKRAALSAF